MDFIFCKNNKNLSNFYEYNFKIYGFHLTANTTNNSNSQPIKKAHVETHLGTTQTTKITKLSKLNDKINSSNIDNNKGNKKNNSRNISISTKNNHPVEIEHLSYIKGIQMKGFHHSRVTKVIKPSYNKIKLDMLYKVENVAVNNLDELLKIQLDNTYFN